MSHNVRAELFPQKKEMFSWIEDLSQWGHRKTGTPEGMKSAEYIADKFKEFGLEEIKIEEVPAVFMNCSDYHLTIEGKEIECFPGNGTNRRGETGVFEIGGDNEEYEFSDDEVISDAYCFNEEGIPIVSMIAAEMYIYHPSDKPDKIPVEQLEPVGIAFSEIAAEAMKVL